MPRQLQDVLETLRRHKDELRRRGVAHAAVFGSVARGEATDASDVDVLVDLDPTRPIGVFAYAGIGLFLGDVLGREVDLVDREVLRPRFRAAVLRDAVEAF
jgi:uncharacterized protein